MFKKIEELYFDISNYLIQKLDCGDYDHSMFVDDYLNAVDPDIYALYKVLDNILNKNN